MLQNQQTPAQVSRPYRTASRSLYTACLRTGFRSSLLCLHVPAGRRSSGNALCLFRRRDRQLAACHPDKKGFTLLLCVASSVALACMGYAALLKGLELAFHVSSAHQAGYICAMLFIIPGFPFITSGIDLAKLDMRSGLERLRLFADHRYRCCAGSLGDGTPASPEAIGFSTSRSVQYHNAAAPPGGKLLRRIRVFHHVQQPL